MTWPTHSAWGGFSGVEHREVAVQIKISAPGDVRRSAQRASGNADSISYVDEKEVGDILSAFKRRSRYLEADSVTLFVLDTRK